MNKYLIFLFPAGAVLWFLILWIVPGSAPNSHVIAFLASKSSLLFYFLLIGDIAATAWVVIGYLRGAYTIETAAWPWIIAIAFGFAFPAMIAYTRFAVANDPNIAARYAAFITTQGWKS
jgi:hypothetical protein